MIYTEKDFPRYHIKVAVCSTKIINQFCVLISGDKDGSNTLFSKKIPGLFDIVAEASDRS